MEPDPTGAQGRASLPEVGLAGRRSRQRPVLPGDLPAIYELSMSPRLWLSWRDRGVQRPFEEWRHDFFRGSVLHTIVYDTADLQPQGVLSAFEHDPAAARCHVAGARFGDGWSLAFAEATAVFVHHLFTVFGLRKVSLEVPEYNLSSLSSIVRLVAEPEGRLREHIALAGDLWDLHLFAIAADRWHHAITTGPLRALGLPDVAVRPGRRR